MARSKKWPATTLRQFIEFRFLFAAFECMAIEESAGVVTPEQAWFELCEAYEAATGYDPPTYNDLPEDLKQQLINPEVKRAKAKPRAPKETKCAG